MEGAGVWLPREIWGLVLGFSSDASTFRALALTCKDFASLARGEKMQETMKRRFAREYRIVVWQGEQTEFVLPNGTKHGTSTLWWGIGEKRARREGLYRDGKREGMWMEWYTNGNKQKEGKYRNGKKEEMWTMWYPNEQIWSEISYRDGKKYKWHGVWVQNG